VQVILPGATFLARAQAQKPPYPAMALLDRYLMPDENAEIALARTAAPPSISDAAEVMVLKRSGYATAVKGSNGFLCLVERSWGAATDDSDFWNPKVRAPICFNPLAASAFVPIFLMKTKLVLAGKSKTKIVQATSSALDRKELPALERGAMCYMMSNQQYRSDRDMSWHPHLMFFVCGQRGEELGSQSAGLASYSGGRDLVRAAVFCAEFGFVEVFRTPDTEPVHLALRRKQMDLCALHRRPGIKERYRSAVPAASACHGNLTPSRSATASGASGNCETGSPLSRHPRSPPSSTHTFSTPIRFNAMATRAFTISRPDEQ
jgi:hypothetical protein